jgi:hypothetical protein
MRTMWRNSLARYETKWIVLRGTLKYAKEKTLSIPARKVLAEVLTMMDSIEEDYDQDM